MSQQRLLKGLDNVTKSGCI